MRIYKHKGYTLRQTTYNYHYTVFTEDGHMVMHVPYDKPVTQEKAKEFIDCYILLSEKASDIVDDLEDGEE